MAKVRTWLGKVDGGGAEQEKCEWRKMNLESEEGVAKEKRKEDNGLT